MGRAFCPRHRARRVGSGAKGDELVLRSDRGYLGPQSRLQMLQNKEFVDARVEIFGKHGSRTWVKIGEYTSIASCSPNNIHSAASSARGLISRLCVLGIGSRELRALHIIRG